MSLRRMESNDLSTYASTHYQSLSALSTTQCNTVDCDHILICRRSPRGGVTAGDPLVSVLALTWCKDKGVDKMTVERSGR